MSDVTMLSKRLCHFFFIARSSLNLHYKRQLLSSILLHPVSHFPLKMLKPPPLFGFTVVLSAAGVQEVRFAQKVPSQDERTNDFFVGKSR